MAGVKMTMVRSTSRQGRYSTLAQLDVRIICAGGPRASALNARLQSEWLYRVGFSKPCIEVNAYGQGYEVRAVGFERNLKMDALLLRRKAERG